MTTDLAFEARYQHATARARTLSASLEGPSLLERLARLPRAERDAILAGLSTLELTRLLYDWAAWARPKQDPSLADVPHRILFLLGGRAAGKTLSGAQRVRRRIDAGARSIAIVGPTLRDVERYQITGEGGADGILTVFPPSQRPVYRSHKALVYFHTGAVAYVNSAEKPEFRGPNLDTVWADEPAKWRFLQTIWNNIELATRLPGRLPLEIVLTGTPLPLQLLREIIADEDTTTILMRQEENAANLDPTYIAKMRRRYGSTRLGRQELEGEILTDNPDALFSASLLDLSRVESAPDLDRVAVAVDPAVATGKDNDETGIIVGGIDAAGHIYVLADLTSKSKPERWGADVVVACEQHEADVVVCERNRGGDLVAANVRAAVERKRGDVAARALKIVEVHATRGKAIRAEPVSALHEQGRLHIVGRMPELEGELCEWNPRLGGPSPNRLDALVWLVWYLARLGEEAKDHRAGFRGLGAAARALSAPAASPGLAALLPRSDRGSTI